MVKVVMLADWGTLVAVAVEEEDEVVRDEVVLVVGWKNEEVVEVAESVEDDEEVAVDVREEVVGVDVVDIEVIDDVVDFVRLMTP